MTDRNGFGEVICPPAAPAQVRALLARYGLKPNKALGQNFFVDAPLLDRLVEKAGFHEESIIEVGPGLGALTQALLKTGCRVAAVEKDGNLCPILEEMFPAVKLIHGDFLHVDLVKLFEQLGGKTVSFAGNLPYYVTTPIALRMIESELPVDRTFLMVQHEAAAHFTAVSGDKAYGPLSVLAHVRFRKVENLLTISPASYYPQPEVYSDVVLLTDGCSMPAGFATFVKSTFAMRRKTLLNNLSAAGYQKSCVPAWAAAKRAEALTPEELLELYRQMQ